MVYYTVRGAKDVAEIIEQEHARGNQVIVNVSRGRKPQIAATAGISEGMTYNHLRGLKRLGYMADGESGYVITDSGGIA